MPDTPSLECRGLDGVGCSMTLATFCRRLMALGPGYIVITDGKDGAYIGTRSGITHCPARPVAIVGTAGAGDAFNATFAAYVQTGATVDEAVTAAAINSASVVTHLDTQTGLLRLDELTTRIRETCDHMGLCHWSYRQPSTE